MPSSADGLMDAKPVSGGPPEHLGAGPGDRRRGAEPGRPGGGQERGTGNAMALGVPGLWRIAYAPRSALALAAVLGFSAGRSATGS